MQKSQNDTTTTTNSPIRVSETAPTPSPPPTTTATGGSVPACASCRHQRKKCPKTCVLAPFFPAEKSQDFQSVHRVFGISNVTKLVKGLSQEDGKKVIDSLIWEAYCWIKDPVLGPLGEFQRVCEELRFYKTQYQQFANIHHNLCQVPVAQRSIGSWNGDNNGINNGSNSGYIGGMDHNMDNNIDHNMTRMFNYGSLQSMESVKQERGQQQGSLIHPNQQMMNDFSQFY